MAVTSKGYIDQIMPGVDWARAQWGLGSRYWVYDPDSVKVTQVVGGTREVSISSGYFGAWGVVDNNSSAAIVQLPTVASGTKWFLIVARRTWGASAAASSTVFTYIDVGVNPVVPMTSPRNMNIGVLDDQPLALVPLTAGQTQPGTPRDLRAVGTGKDDMLIFDPLAMTYLGYVGMRVRYGGVNYRYLGIASSWVAEPNPYMQVTGLVTASGADLFTEIKAGWSIADTICVGYRYGNVTDLYINGRRTGGRIAPDSLGNFADDQTMIGRLKPEWRPPFDRRVTGEYRGRADGGFTNFVALGGYGYISASGVVSLSAGVAGIGINTNPVAGSNSLSFSDTFIIPTGSSAPGGVTAWV